MTSWYPTEGKYPNHTRPSTRPSPLASNMNASHKSGWTLLAPTWEWIFPKRGLGAGDRKEARQVGLAGRVRVILCVERSGRKGRDGVACCGRIGERGALCALVMHAGIYIRIGKVTGEERAMRMRGIDLE